jgi:hypothetical protein
VVGGQSDAGERGSRLGEDEAQRKRHVATFEAMFPEYLARIEWPAGRVRSERFRALRALLAAAVRGSPWHRERLGDIDAARLN